MRWQEGRRSTNIEDCRGAGGFAGPGIRIGIPSRGGAGFGGLGLIGFLVVAVLLGVDPSQILGPGIETEPAPSANDSQLEQFVAVVLADTEDVWHQIFAARRLSYREPKLVLFSGATESGCGLAQTAVGPFYCPVDERVYLDLSFFNDLKSRFIAPGDFAQAYVIAHEVGHHVQDLLGVFGKEEAHGPAARGAGGLSVRTELQADCFAGIWAPYADRILGVVEPGDVEEATGAAAAVGDDRLQREVGGRVMPDSFALGTSDQRARWFDTGYQSGRITSCDTFGAHQL